ncbi:phosphonate metabolism transcriptional regulator PhnF [Magnetovibrio sp.]|uniref:phosphonate metabolism transcriptional regulator PhnF n=1 Tax=Magnetovibrio sp. TaxID=2024836 RepID=UPI002F925609
MIAHASPPEPAHIERGHGVALWRQIREALKSEILAGDIRPGDMLPTEQALSARFSVNRHTVRRAIASLTEDGLVAARQGHGTYVPEAILDYAVKKRTRFSEAVSAQSRVPNADVIAMDVFASTAKIAKALGIRRGVKVMRIRTLGGADGRPLSLADHHFVASRFPGLDKAVAETGSISAALRMFGVTDYVRKTTQVTARLPNREDAELLAQPASRPVLMAESVNVLADGTPLEYGRTQFCGDRVQMLFET